MHKFKELEWNLTQESEGIHADPNGLEYKYLISPIHDGKVKFAILDANYENLPKFPEICESTNLAKQKANDHYQSILQNFIA